MIVSGKGRLIIMDTEFVGLLPKIRHNKREDMHVLVCRDVMTDEEFIFFDPYEERNPETRVSLQEWEGHQDGDLADGVQFLLDCEAWGAHNTYGFDFFALKKVFPELMKGENPLQARGKNSFRPDIMPMRCMDTLVMSRVLNPDRKLPPQAYALGQGNTGPHSIAAHGMRIGRWKPEHEDWSRLTDDMIHRCREDTAIGRDYLLWLLNNDWKEHVQRGANPRTGLTILSAFRMESSLAYEAQLQEIRGFRLDVDLCISRCKVLDKEIDETNKAFRPHMPPRIKNKPMSADHIARVVKESQEYAPLLGLKPLTPLDFAGVERRGDRMTQWCLTKKDGGWTSAVQKDYPHLRGNINDVPEIDRIGSYSPVTFEEIPLGSRDTVKQVLFEYGWLGVDYNDTELEYIDEFGTLPKPWAGKINEKSVKHWIERLEAEGEQVPEWCLGIARWYILSSRRTQILNGKDIAYYRKNGHWPVKSGSGGERGCRGLLPAAFNAELGITAQEYREIYGYWPTSDKCDGEWRVPAKGVPIGTNTFRWRHKVVVNIPARGLFPLRDLFIASKGKMIVGCDGAGLELRVLAHFMNDPEYADIVLNGDIHTHNQKKAGLSKRDLAKTFIYAFLYGSGVAGLAALCQVTETEMRKVMDNFMRELPLLEKLINGVKATANKLGYVQAPDGRWGRIRRRDGKYLEHTALNVLLQMTGSICMKWARYLAGKTMREEGVALDWEGNPAVLADVHDEHQMEVNEDEVEVMTYQLEAKLWKDNEEKREHFDDQGRMWSAANIIEGNPKEDEFITCERMYHRAGHIMAESITKAGELLKFRIPMAGEYKLGRSWAETH
ncbi:MAG: hypothetical protein [Caudoviricetes sp.]|nr:MAG: hypothetical protein [Caudoviricetes sp.]